MLCFHSGLQDEGTNEDHEAYQCLANSCRIRCTTAENCDRVMGWGTEGSAGYRVMWAAMGLGDRQEALEVDDVRSEVKSSGACHAWNGQ
jgi:hypothetical protein